MKSESKKYEPKEKKKWLISYDIYRVTTSITTRVDVGTKVVEGYDLQSAYESLRMENHKLVVTFIYPL